MSPSGSVTHWLSLLQAGDTAAAQPLWERYFRRLVGLARARLQDAPRRAADEEDVALSAFDSFCRAAARGRFPRLADREDLWRILVVITARKALHLVRDERRQKRGGGRVVTEADLYDAGGGEEAGLARVIGAEPTPDFVAQLIEEYRRLLGMLDDEQLRALAQAWLEGCTAEELARRFACAPRSIGRKLLRIRRIWSQEIARE
jgi:DNA-directed RNA polymerase specialized sigma24 family protein